MGWTVLYIAFGIVALWLLGEVLLQYKARLRWRALAFVGFLGVVVGVVLPSIVVIVLGAAAFAVGQSFVTLSFRRGYENGWALGGRPKQSRRRKGAVPPGDREPSLEVSDVEFEQGPGDADFTTAGPAGGPEAVDATAVFSPEPSADDTGQQYGVYADTHSATGFAPYAAQGAYGGQGSYDGQSAYGQDTDGHGAYDGQSESRQGAYAAYADPYAEHAAEHADFAEQQADYGVHAGYEQPAAHDPYAAVHDPYAAQAQDVYAAQDPYAAAQDPYAAQAPYEPAPEGAGAPYDYGAQQPYGDYAAPYGGYDAGYDTAPPFVESFDPYANETPPGGVWVPPQRGRAANPQDPPYGYDPHQGQGDQQYY